MAAICRTRSREMPRKSAIAAACIVSLSVRSSQHGDAAGSSSVEPRGRHRGTRSRQWADLMGR